MPKDMKVEMKIELENRQIRDASIYDAYTKIAPEIGQDEAIKIIQDIYGNDLAKQEVLIIIENQKDKLTKK